MESFIVKLGNSLTTAFGISAGATSTLLTLGVIWFYIFKWKPMQKLLEVHALEEADANGSYAERAAERDRATEEMNKTLNELNVVLTAQKDHISKMKTEIEKAQFDRDRTTTLLENMRTDLTKITTIMAMSPNARSLV